MAEPAGFPREDLDTLSRSPSGNDFRRGRGLAPVPTLEESLTPFEAADTWWLAAAIWQATRESPAEPVIPIDSKDSAPEEAHQVKGGEFEPPNERPPDADDAAEANSGDDESRAATPDRSAQVLQLGTMTWSDDIGSGSLLVSSGLAVARSPLSDAVAMARALRPLHRRVLARHGPEGILDEEATAERAVQDQLWLPVIRPVMERWLDLTLVVDANPSTVLWRSTISAFESFLEQLGTFRTIQRRLLDSVALTAGAPEIPMLRGEVADTPPRPPAEVADTTGRRVVLVVTDGVSNRWRDDSFGRVLAHWGRSMPTSVIHLLPQRLWPKGGLRPHRATLTTHGRLKPNARWAVSLPDSWLEPGPEVPEHKVPVPVFELEARWLRRWVQLLLGHNDHPIDTTVWLTDDSRRTEQEIIEKDAENPEKEIPEGVSSLERVNYFRHTASPTAFRLASLLAAVPVTLAVARSVLDELVPEAGVEHLAEVLTSGLFETDPGEGERRRSDNLRYHARQGVREELLSGLRRSDTVRVLCTVSERFGGQFASLRRMYRAISEPNSTPIPDDSVSMSDLANERAVMNALSGPYLERAQRLTVIEDKLSRPSGQEPDTPSVGSRTMSKTAEGTATDPGRPISVASAQTDIPDDEFSTGSQVQSASGYPRSSLSPLLGYERRGDEAPPVWGNVPPRNPNFTGRIEFLENLNRQLAVGPTTAVLPAALHGMGG
ncbi:MAG TPA: SAV_2336 N-terminal domain-related protein, partial [Pseudonocardiaceae bacterium]|nr:SAV_2336 N-terminal domain-related protein [Pseudonocardiaceae bacterium]